MEKQILKTVLTVEFAADEMQIAANAMQLIAAARKGTLAVTGDDPEPKDEKDPEPEKPTRSRRSRRTTDEAPATRSRRSEPEPEPEAEENDARPERGGRSTDVTHDDIRDLMAEVIEYDDSNRSKVLKQLTKIGAKSVGTIKDEDVADFFEFLQTLKD